jgi:drug/metabolite transporter (DMT)-like permease
MNTNFVMGVQSLFACMISTGIIRAFKMGSFFKGFSRGDLVVGSLNFCTMYCSNFALKFVNYPFMALAKSAKILPVILTGWLTGAYKLQRSQVAIALTISLGLVIFNASKIRGGFFDDSSFGIMLVVMSLMFDGFVNSQTDKNH